MLDVVNPFQAATQGFNSGLQISNNIDVLKANRAEEERKQQAALQQQQMQQDLLNFSQNPNKTAEDYANIITRYPSLAEPYQKAWGMLDDGRKQQTLSTASQVFAALSNGASDVAKQIIDKEALAFENSGMKREAFNMRNISKMIDSNPEAAKSSIGFLMSTANPDQFKDVLSTIGSEGRANEMQPYQIDKIKAETESQKVDNAWKGPLNQASISNIESQVQERAARLGLDRDKFISETQIRIEELGRSKTNLTPATIDRINNYIADSVTSNEAAGSLNDLAGKLDSLGGGYGRFSNLAEWWARSTGNQDAMSQARQEYVRLRNSEVIKNLPPGAASDKDIEILMNGFPPENADSKYVASFIRGMAKANQRDAAYKQMQAEWMNQNGTLGASQQDLSINGIRIPKGTNFGVFSAKNLDKVLKEQNDLNVQKRIATGTTSYAAEVQQKRGSAMGGRVGVRE